MLAVFTNKAKMRLFRGESMPLTGEQHKDTQQPIETREELLTRLDVLVSAEELKDNLAALEAFAQRRWGDELGQDGKPRWELGLLFAKSSHPQMGLRPHLPKDEWMTFGFDFDAELDYHASRIIDIANTGWYVHIGTNDGVVDLRIVEFNGDKRDIWSVSKANYVQASGVLTVEPNQVIWD